MHRSRVEIVAGVLEAAKRSATITRIMYQAGMNCRHTQKYVNLLVQEGFLEVTTQGKKRYFLTSERGLKYLRKYNELIALL